jgi:hypothetical protein
MRPCRAAGQGAPPARATDETIGEELPLAPAGRQTPTRWMSVRLSRVMGVFSKMAHCVLAHAILQSGGVPLSDLTSSSTSDSVENILRSSNEQLLR